MKIFTACNLVSVGHEGVVRELVVLYFWCVTYVWLAEHHVVCDLLRIFLCS